MKKLNDFKNFDARSTDKNITSYLSLKGKYDFHRTHVIFINQYIKQYDFLNNYNKKVLDVLLTNRNAIIKSSYVVIPDTGSEVLRDMNLLITEQEFKGEYRTSEMFFDLQLKDFDIFIFIYTNR